MNTDIVMNNANTSVSVKVARGEEKRRFNFSGKSFGELKAVISEIFSVPVDDFTLQYQDDEKDRVTLSSDAELNEAIKLHKYVLRFFVINKNATTAATNQQSVPNPFQPPFAHRQHYMLPSPPVPAPTEGQGVAQLTPPPFQHHHRGGRRGGHGPWGEAGHHGHGHHGKKRCMDKEERKNWKCEQKRAKKQKKCESSSSSSSSESDAEKVQRKEMKQLMKATKEQIKMNWAATKAANPTQWSENKKLMVAEIKAAKRLIREQAKNPAGLVPVEQNVTPTAPVAEMQA